MKNLIILSAAVIILGACQQASNNDDKNEEMVVIPHRKTFYFERHIGLKDHDTGFVLLDSSNNYLGSEEKCEAGMLHGFKTGSYIFAAYTHFIDSANKTDTSFVAFKIQGQWLLQKSSMFRYETSISYFDDTSDYNIRYRFFPRKYPQGVLSE